MDDILTLTVSALCLFSTVYGAGYAIGWLIGLFRSFSAPDERD